MCSQCDAYKKQIESLKKAKKDKTASLRRTIDELNRQIGSLKTQNEELEDEIFSLQGAIEKLRDTKASFKTKCEGLEEEKENLQGQNEDLEEELETLRAESKELKGKYQTLQNENKELKRQNKSLRAQNRGQEGESQTLRTQNEELEEVNETLCTKNEELEEENRSLQAQLKNVKDENVSLRKDLKARENYFSRGRELMKSVSACIMELDDFLEHEICNYPCREQRCKTCRQINATDKFTSSSSSGSKQYKVTHPITCQTKNLVYLIQCKKCPEQYVGETELTLNQRMIAHRSDIRGKHISCGAVEHFCQENHSVNDLQVMGIEAGLENRKLRKQRERYWIQTLDTLENGMNKKL